MIRPSNTEMTAPKSRHFLLSPDFILPMLILTIGTVIFRLTNLDLTLQSRYYDPISGWAFNSSPLALFIYHYSNIPALILSLGALVGFVLCYSKPRFLPHRKIFIFLVLAMVVGPGILVNSLLKDNWGRPRPRELVQYGGEHAYEALLTVDATSPGKSFPCGHATMGFYFFALAFVLRKHRANLANLTLVAALVWGLIIGWIRMGQGGHFASDVLWAGTLVYLSSFLLFRALALHRNLFFVPSDESMQRKLKPLQKLLLALLGLLITIGVMLATPYSANQEYKISSQLGNGTNQSLELNFSNAVVRISLRDSSLLDYRANGFGFPGSKLKSIHSYNNKGFTLTQQQQGFFTELVCEANVSVDTLRVLQTHLSIGKGELLFSLPALFSDTLYVSPRTKVVNNKSNSPTIIIQSKPVGRYWLDVPLLKLSKTP
ncbi:MAG: hypothetical protein CVU50_00910 [Candidatus Cloacimonetes bacterium HGW-Cloacimonetes-3]|jgi:membrane-associated PAP2 superfamily phosphatase|nr:MAG: hypothetical protein CVU50_00910 [Candidatus Cloacimonetes bacterium HGW-Cloacimonetes-3]